MKCPNCFSSDVWCIDGGNNWEEWECEWCGTIWGFS